MHPSHDMSTCHVMDISDDISEDRPDMSCVGFNNVLSLIAQGKICFSDLCLSQMILYANLHD